MIQTNKYIIPFQGLLLMIFVLALYSCHRQSPSHHLKNGSAKYQLKDYSGAIGDLDEAIRLKENYKEAYYLRALCLVSLNRFNKAAADFDKVIEIDPYFKDAWFNRAYYIKQNSGDYKAAINDYNRFIELSPGGDHSFALNNRGYAKYKLNDLDGALKDIDNSISLNMGNSYAYRNRALVYISLDSITPACQDIQTALDLGFTRSYGGEVQGLYEQYCEDSEQ